MNKSVPDRFLKDLRKWVKKHPYHRFIDQEYLFQRNRNISRDEALRAFERLERDGYIKFQIALEDSNGAVLYELYDSLEEVPKHVTLDDGSEKRSAYFRTIGVMVPTELLK